MSNTNSKPKTTKSVADWKKRKVHEGVTLPSGVIVSIELPNLGALIKSGQIPNPLIDAAIQHAQARKITPEMLSETWDFTRWIVPRMVISPEITEEDVDHLPAEDVEMLAGFASRSNDIDAVGHHLGGLESFRTFRELRGLITLDEALEGTS